MTTLLAILVAVGMWTWAVAHQIVIYYVIAGLIEQLPPPDSQSGKVYIYIYGVLQMVAANWRRTKDAVKNGGSNVPKN